MLNIRINLTIDLKKVGIAVLAGYLALSPVMSAPAQALEVKAFTFVKPQEKVVTVNLTHLKVQTTQTGAQEAISSPTVKYFDAEALAFLTVYANGWSMKDWDCLRYVWNKESHFNPKAKNMGSGAYGIAQFMPATWGNYKVVKTSEANLQIKYGLRYIKVRYGSKANQTGACNAKAFWQKHNWY